MSVSAPGSAAASADAFDLPAYLRRIGYDGARTPSLATLNALCWHHATTIPFENLDVLAGRSIALTPAALIEKLVHARRGGYCFEQNNLLRLALTALGFRVTLLGGRVRGPIPRTVVPYRTHVFLRVQLPEGEFLADVGLGSASLTCALPLDFTREFTTPHEPHRLVHEDGKFFHQIPAPDGWMDVVEFTLEEFFPVDCEVGNWWTSAHPQSHFRHNLVLGRADADGTRHGIRDGEYLHRRGVRVLHREKIGARDHLQALLAQHFHLHLPAELRLGPAGAPWAG